MRSDTIVLKEIENLETMQKEVQVDAIQQYCKGALDALRWAVKARGSEQKSPTATHAQPAPQQ